MRCLTLRLVSLSLCCVPVPGPGGGVTLPAQFTGYDALLDLHAQARFCTCIVLPALYLSCPQIGPRSDPSLVTKSVLSHDAAVGRTLCGPNLYSTTPWLLPGV